MDQKKEKNIAAEKPWGSFSDSNDPVEYACPSEHKPD